MVLGKRWLFAIGKGAEIRSLEKGRKSPAIIPITVSHSRAIGKQQTQRQQLEHYSLSI